MATPTYELLDSTTLASAQSSVTFTSIDQSYGDLVLVVDGGNSATGTIAVNIYPNADTGNASSVEMQGDGSSAASNTRTQIIIALGRANSLHNIQVMDYSATDKHKTFLIRDGHHSATPTVRAHAGRWGSTSAITSLQLATTGGNTLDAGSTFHLYGIAK